MMNDCNSQYNNKMLKLIKKVNVFLYDLFISTFFTIAAHIALVHYMHLSAGNFLDIGCGTGAPLAQISHHINKFHQNIVGIDIHPQYTEKAMEIFKHDKNVQIYNMDFYKIEQYLKLKFRFIFFSFSFMLMQDRAKAIDIAKSILERNESSRIAFVLTLNKNKNSLLSKLKPLIYNITSIDFGNVVCEEDFFGILADANMEVMKKIRLEKGWNILLKLFPVYYVECRVKV